MYTSKFMNLLTKKLRVLCMNNCPEKRCTTYHVVNVTNFVHYTGSMLQTAAYRIQTTRPFLNIKRNETSGK
jgi:hypothetical protein